MILQSLIYLPNVLAIFIIGLFSVYKKSNKGMLPFALFTFSVAAWLLTQYFTQLNINNSALFFAQLTDLIANFLAVSFLWFITSYVGKNFFSYRKTLAAILLIPFVLFSLLSFSGLMIKEVEVTDIGFAIKDAGILYFIQTALIGLTFIAGFGILIRDTLQHKKSERFRNYLLIIALVQAAFINLMINTFFATVAITQVFVPLSFVIMVTLILYAIIKHRLFDIRLVVARSVAYLLSVGSLAVLYSVVSFGLINSLLPASSSENIKQIEYTILAIILAFTFQPLKRFFDRWSNKLFYRDAYDSQELLDGLNKVLVSTIDLDRLLKNSAEIINQSIKSDFVMFGVKEISKTPQRVIGTQEKSFTQEDIQAVRAITPKLRQKSIVFDELEEKDTRLKELLRKNNISVLVRLTDTPTKTAEGIGYIVLGPKKSGSPYSRQDIQVLEIIADELVIAIQNALRFEEIQQFNITLQDKVDEATKKLRSANHRLIELDQTKDDFISMASHQLRTPLTSVKGYISMVMEGDAGKISKKQSELLDQAFVSSQRMVYLIADLLNVSRLRTGKFVIEPKETNLADVIEGEISQLKESAKSRNLELIYDKPADFPKLMLDETKIRQVIMNFADNAIYYTPAGGHIKVALVDKGDSIEFTVTDDGIGVPKNEQHHLFSKFYRAGNAKKARPDGTGLGLFMAKKVVVAQGGNILFQTQEGKGSTFGFSFAKKQLLPENFKGVVAKTTEN